MWKSWACTLVLAVGIFAIPDDSPLLLPAQLSAPPAASEAEGWVATAHLTHNAFFLWRAEALQSIIHSLGYRTAPALEAKLSLTVFMLGLACLLAYNAPFLKACLQPCLAALTSVLLLLLFGFDRVIISALAWLPWLVLLIANYTTRMRYKQWALMSIIISALALNSNQISSLMIGGACVIGLILRGRFAWTPVLLASLGVTLALLRIPAINFPDYPPLAHVVPYDGVAGLARPLIGPTLPIAVINRQTVRAAYAWPSLALLVMSSFFFVTHLWRKTSSDAASRLLCFTCILCGAAFLDLFLPASLSAIAPLAALSRLIPFLSFFPLAAVALAMALVTLVVSLVRLTPKELMLGGVLLLVILPGLIFASGRAPFLHDKSSQILLDALSQPTLAQEETKARYDLILASPSLNLIKENGLWVLANQSRIKSAAFIPLNPDETTLSASHNNSARVLKKLSQGYKKGRWSPKRGFQDGTEWLHIFFNTPRRLSGLELNTGSFPADFPRGLRLSYLPSCRDKEREDHSALSSYRILLHLPAWQGEILFTPLGYPYYGAQSAVRIHFPEVIEAQCLLIQQTAKEANFDWSVAKILVAEAPT